MSELAQFRFDAIGIITAAIAAGGFIFMVLMIYGMWLNMVLGPDNKANRVAAIRTAQKGDRP